MQIPATDSAEYADLLDQIASTIRLPETVRQDDDAACFPWSTRAMAMTQTFFVVANAAAARPSA